MKRFLCLLMILFFSGCASNPQKDPQKESADAKFKAKDWRGAYDDYVQCSGRHVSGIYDSDTICMGDAGAAAWNMGDRAAAQRWWTLAASRGSNYAKAQLTAKGMPVPPEPAAQPSSPT
ncbi:MAG: hypothetical protein SGJ20_20590, partial [Planctomycetota bacterium]|nr:hypothetical protein [Planctomycetota bacterium]